MGKQETDGRPISSGVDDLISRLREEGVSAGRMKAEAILADAKAEAARMLAKATAEAQQKLEAARREAESFRSAGKEALKTAMRDTVLEMKINLTEGFSSDVKRLVSRELQDPEVLRRMILEVAGRARDQARMGDDERLEIILPESAVGLEELRRNPQALEEGPLTKFVFGLTREMLRQGVTFSASGESAAGIRVQLKDKDVILDLTEEAVAALLLRHLQPRFRAVLEGVVR